MVNVKTLGNYSQTALMIVKYINKRILGFHTHDLHNTATLESKQSSYSFLKDG